MKTTKYIIMLCAAAAMQSCGIKALFGFDEPMDRPAVTPAVPTTLPDRVEVEKATDADLQLPVTEVVTPDVPTTLPDSVEVEEATEADKQLPATEVTVYPPTPEPSDEPQVEPSSTSHVKPPKATPHPVAQSQLAKDLQGEWHAVRIDRTDINFDDEDMPYIIFAIDKKTGEGRIYGNSGCNSFSGSYDLDDSELTCSDMLSTLMMCRDMSRETIINKILGSTHATVSITANGDEYALTISGAGHSMRLIRQDRSWLNGKWIVEKVGDEAIDDDEVNLFFDVPQNSVHGNTGCNFFNGKMTFDLAEPDAISLSDMGVTRMSCPQSERETRLLVALEQVVAYNVDAADPDVMYLIGYNGERMLTLRKTKLTD